MNKFIITLSTVVGLILGLQFGTARFSQAQSPTPASSAIQTTTEAQAASSPSVSAEASASPEKSAVVQTPVPSSPKKKGYRYMFAIFDTTLGKFKVKLLPESSPKTVDNFVGLAEGTKEWKDPITFELKKTHFYDGLTFHRIIPKFMIQGGDPQGNGMGGPGYEFADERNPNLSFDKPGILAMANRGPNTNGSQFFVTTDPVTFLNDKPGQHYTIFGEVVEGMDIVRKISQVPTDKTNDRPLKPVKINKVTIQRK